MKKYFFLLLMLCGWGLTPVCSQSISIDTLLYQGSSDSLVNVVLVADGYTEAEKDHFRDDCRRVFDYFFITPPINRYRAFFNFFIVFYSSPESGVNHPRTSENDDCASVPVLTAENLFNTTFDYAGIHRLIYPANIATVDRTLALSIPDYDLAVVIGNSPYYGGSGGRIACMSAHEYAPEIFMHELGHTFADLCDEYPYPGSVARERPNCTQDTLREKIKWTSWINPDTPVPTAESFSETEIGLYEGANYNPSDWYRPIYDCKMRSLGRPFCAVCAQEIVMTIHKRSYFLKNRFPRSEVVRSSGRAMTFSVTARLPEPSTLAYRWFLNEKEIIGAKADTFVLPAETALPARLRVEISDKTELIRNESHTEAETESAMWFIRAKPASTDDRPPAVLPLTFPTNPAENIIRFSVQVNSCRTAIYSITDFNGKRVYEHRETLQEGIRTVEIPTENLPSGVYLLNVRSADDANLIPPQRLVIIRP